MKHIRSVKRILLFVTMVLTLSLFVGRLVPLAADTSDWLDLFIKSGWFDSEDAQSDTGRDSDDAEPADSGYSESRDKDDAAEGINEDGEYTSKEEVAEYIHLYGHLPDNYITKKEAKKLGWENRDGNLDEVAPGKSIGGDYFGNYEGNLPTEKGRDYYECDIDYEGGYRGAKRIIYSNDGFIYYTEDHYNTFELLYEGDE